MRIEIRHLAQYLPYDMEFSYKGGTCYTMIGLGQDYVVPLETKDTKFFLGDIKPILRPTSDLYKEIEHRGKKITPLLELAAIAGLCDASDWYINNDEARHNRSKGCSFRLEFDSDAAFIFRRSDEWKDFEVPMQQFRLFNLLFEWHFDVHGLIELGLAVELESK